MKREQNHQIGFWSMILLGINAIVGSGIFLLPGKVMSLVGNWSSIVYLFVTLLVLAIAWCFAQCASLFNRNGGAYVYAKEAFGNFVGFEIGLMRWAVGMIAWATLVVGFLTALGAIWPQALKEPIRSLLIFGLVGGLTLINLLGIRLFRNLNNFIAIAKLIPLILFICVGSFYIQPTHYTPLIWQEFEITAFTSAALIIFYAFGGFETLVVAAGEMKNPQKNLPIAVMIVIACCSVLYFLIQWIAIGLLGEALADSSMPIADAAQILFGESGKWIVTIAMLISIGGINLSASFITPRSGAALAEDELIPKWIAVKGRFNTPTGAIVLSGLLTIALALSGTFVQLAVISVIARFIQYISTCLAVYVLHMQYRKPLTSFKRGMMAIMPMISVLGIGWLLLHATFFHVAWGLGSLVLGVPLYTLQQKVKSLRNIH